MILYLDEILVFSLECRYGSGISTQFVGECVLFLDNTAENVFAIVEELVQFTRGGQHLCSGVDQLEQISPGFVQIVLPFGDCGSV